ncbi:MAG: helix-turn-helix domain-containing protein [Candidatus Scalindua sp.]|nr:helix-turn-helix domain-containing protein [Candidatus Scalindua sp.]
MKRNLKNNYKHLSSEERDKIAVLRVQGISLNNIAKRITRWIKANDNRASSKGSNIVTTTSVRLRGTF